MRRDSELELRRGRGGHEERKVENCIAIKNREIKSILVIDTVKLQSISTYLEKWLSLIRIAIMA